MNTKILVSLLVIGLTAIAIGGSMTGAFFSDAATSTENTFASGSLNLQVSNDTNNWKEGDSKTITASGIVPGQIITPQKICFKNAGTIDGNFTATITYPPNMGSPAYDAFAKRLWINNSDMGAGNVAPYWAQQIIDERYPGNAAGAVTAGEVVPFVNPSGPQYLPTAYGLQFITMRLWNTYSAKIDQPLTAGNFICETITVQFDPSAGNEFQSNSMDFTITGNLKQIGAP